MIPAAVLGALAITFYPSDNADTRATCIDPRTHGAVPDDGRDDRVGLQAALDAAAAVDGCVDLGSARWDVARRTQLGVQYIPSLVLRGGTRLRGDGAVLAMLGSGKKANGVIGDWVLLQVQDATGPVVSGIIFDGAARVNTGEQTHLLQIRGPTRGALLEHLRFHMPTQGVRGGGDCLRLFGERSAWVLDTVIRDVHADECDRSFLGFQRGVDGALVERVSILKTQDQAIDFEATEGERGEFECQPINRRITVRNALLHGATAAESAVTIAGRECAVTDEVHFQDVKIVGGNLDILDVRRVTLERVTIEAPDGAPPLIHARRRVGSLRIIDSSARRTGGSPASLIEVKRLSGIDPTEVVIVGGEFSQGTTAPAIHLEHVRSVVVVGTALTLTGEPTWMINSMGTGSVVAIDAQLSGPWLGTQGSPPALVRQTR